MGSVYSSTSDPHGGSACLRVPWRLFYWDLPAQDISAFVENGTTYEFTVWVKLDSGTETVRPQIVIDCSGSDWWTFDPSYTNCTGGTWTEVTSTITPTWDGDLQHATVRVTRQTSNEFWIDDAVLIEQGQSGTSVEMVSLVPGTWRREVE